MVRMNDLTPERRAHVTARLRDDPIAWLTTVRPSGVPDTVPVWFLMRADHTIVVYSRPGKRKLRNLASNPHVALAVDGTSDGFDVIRVEATAEHLEDYPQAPAIPEFGTKYATLLETCGFGTVGRFAEQFSAPVLITPTGIHG